jgi:DNA polymerase III subunit delta'
MKDLEVHSGQKKFLLNALSNKRLSHAYIFSGESGVGKKEVAKWLSGKIKDRVGASWNFQVQEVYPEYPEGGGRGSIKIDQIRSIKKQTDFRLGADGHQIIVIHQADLMNAEAQDAFLKVLEEPKNQTTFILLADRLYSLRSTIKSRCQLVYFSPLTLVQSIDWLKKEGIDKEKAVMIYLLAQGCFSRMMILKQDVSLIQEKLKNWQTFRTIKDIPIYQRFEIANQVTQERESLSCFLNDWLVYLRSMILVKSLKIKIAEELESKSSFLEIGELADKVSEGLDLFERISLNKKLVLEQILI